MKIKSKPNELDFLTDLEKLLEKHVGDKWNYKWEGEFFDDGSHGLRFNGFDVWGFDNEDNE